MLDLGYEMQNKIVLFISFIIDSQIMTQKM